MDISGQTKMSHINTNIWPGNIVSISPPVERLANELSLPVITYKPGGTLGYESVRSSSAFWHLTDRSMVIPVGLWPRARTLLEADGHAITVTDHRQADEHAAIDEILVASSSLDERLFLEILAQHPQGQVEVQRTGTLLHQITLACRLYWRARILIGVATSRLAWRIWDHLRRHLPIDETFLAKELDWCTDRRIVIGTFRKIAPANPRAWHVLLLPRGEESVGEHAGMFLPWLRGLRVYAFVRPGQRRDLRTSLRLEAMAGPIIWSTTPPLAQVGVAIVSGPVLTSLPSPETPLERKRQLWRCHARNRLIAAVSKALASNDRSVLSRYRLDHLVRRSPKSTVVVVESVEHARALAELLPGWRVMHALPGAQDDTAPCEGVIATIARIAQSRVHADVLIRATGGGWPLNVKGFPPTQQEYPDGVLLVDIEDRHEAQATKDGLRRRNDYRRRGWTLRPP